MNTINNIEAVELTGDEAEQVLVSDFGALSLVPTERSEFERKLERAGFTVPDSKRSINREDAGASK